MNRWYRIFPKALSVDQCAQVCEVARRFPLQPSTVGFGEGSRPDEKLRKSGIRWIPRANDDLQWLFSLIRLNVNLANRDNFDLIRIDDFYDVQFTIYRGDEEGHYGWHQDNARLNPDGRSWDRKISVCIQLSKPESDPLDTGWKKWITKEKLTRYRGGEFWVNPGRQVAVPEFKDAGDMLIFPSDLWHEVKPVTSGVRHSLVTWFHGPRWT